MLVIGSFLAFIVIAIGLFGVFGALYANFWAAGLVVFFSGLVAVKVWKKASIDVRTEIAGHQAAAQRAQQPVQQFEQYTSSSLDDFGDEELM